MRRVNGRRSVSLISLLLMQVASLEVTCQIVSEEQEVELLLKRSLLDTKLWAGQTELSNANLWASNRRPCSLQGKRVQLGENLVAGWSDSWAGQLDASLRELELPEDGVLLLAAPEDTRSTKSELDWTSEIPCQPDEPGRETLEFAPEGDKLSWFNPDNWISSLNLPEIEEFLPDSHRIPCAEETVVFGTEFEDLDKPNWNGTRLSFQVNFRASEADRRARGQGASGRVSNLRVAHLRVADGDYSQEQFERLFEAKRDGLGDMLWRFKEPGNALKPNSQLNSLFSIDPTSSDDSLPDRSFCSDQAGCWCTNEQPEVMQLICSFHEQLQASQMECQDPVKSVGFCNPICGHVISLSMDPSLFKEEFVRSQVYGWYAQRTNTDEQETKLFVSPRRVDFNKYEISIQRMSKFEPEGREQLLQDEQNLALHLLEQFQKESIKSFYGIRSVSIQSSKIWRQDNRWFIWFTSSLFLCLLSVVILLLESILIDTPGKSLTSGPSSLHESLWHLASPS